MFETMTVVNQRKIKEKAPFLTETNNFMVWGESLKPTCRTTKKQREQFRDNGWDYIGREWRKVYK